MMISYTTCGKISDWKMVLNHKFNHCPTVLLSDQSSRFLNEFHFIYMLELSFYQATTFMLHILSSEISARRFNLMQIQLRDVILIGRLLRKNLILNSQKNSYTNKWTLTKFINENCN